MRYQTFTPLHHLQSTRWCKVKTYLHHTTQAYTALHDKLIVSLLGLKRVSFRNVGGANRRAWVSFQKKKTQQIMNIYIKNGKPYAVRIAHTVREQMVSRNFAHRFSYFSCLTCLRACNLGTIVSRIVLTL
jgi:hypothetical protein